MRPKLGRDALRLAAVLRLNCVKLRRLTIAQRSFGIFAAHEDVEREFVLAVLGSGVREMLNNVAPDFQFDYSPLALNSAQLYRRPSPKEKFTYPSFLVGRRENARGS